ncbi:hypothetical protein Golax_010529, partial [Gossypium laxum]|nr:hypothetical protein [Gossypium laxum]
MLSALKSRVAKLKGSIRDVRETLDVVEGHTNELDLMKKKLWEYVIEALSANWDVMKEAPNSTKSGQTEKNDALEAMVMALNEKNEAIMEKIKDLEGELAMCRVTAEKKMLASVPKQLIIDVPKPKEFKEMSSTEDVDNGVVDPHMRNKVRPKLGLGRSFRKSSMSSFTPQYVEKEAQMLQITDLSKKAFFFFMYGFKSSIKQELELRGGMEMVERMKKDKLRMATIIRTMRNHKNGKRKPNTKSNRPFKCFLCEGSHM